MNAKSIIIVLTLLSCVTLSVVLYNSLGTEGVLWIFLYGIFGQMCLLLLVFSIGSIIAKRSSQNGPAMMAGAGVSAAIIIVYWIVAVGALSIFR